MPQIRRFLPRVGASLFFLAFCAIAGGAPAEVVGKDALPDVVTARSRQELNEVLERGLPASGGRLFLVSPHDYLPMLLPLRRSGLLKEFVAVFPDEGVFTDVHLENVRSFLLRAGVPEGDSRSLRLDNGVITGKIEEMPLRLLSLAGIPRQVGEFLVVLDTSTFPALYKNEVKTPMLELAWKVVLTLADREVRAKKAVIIDSVGRDDFPLAFGYLASVLREMTASPGQFAGSPPEKWRLLLSAEHAYYFNRKAEAMSLFREYLGKADPDASACYKMALMGIRDLDVEFSIQWLDRAVAADPLYRRAYAEIAGYAHKKNLFDAAERILLAGLARFPKDPLLASSLAGYYISRAEQMQKAEDPKGAAEYLKEAQGIDGAAPAMKERAAELMETPLPPDPR